MLNKYEIESKFSGFKFQNISAYYTREILYQNFVAQSEGRIL